MAITTHAAISGPAPARQKITVKIAAAALVVALLVAAPILSILVIAAFPAENIWPHLFATVLPGYVSETLKLMAGVGVITLGLGTGTAWLVTLYAFPGRRYLEWLLLVPLAMPTYIIAYAYVDLLEYSGAAQTALRALFGWPDARAYWFPQIRSLGGAIWVMSLVLYPYVFLTARAAFVQQSSCLIEASRTMGHTLGATFWSVALPLARPAIAVGVILALMEAMNDVGAVEYFGVDTLTAGVYTTWLQKSNLGGAAQISAVMLVFVFALIAIERQARRGRRSHQTTGRVRAPSRTQLAGARAWGATAVCVAPVLVGFAVPAMVLAGLSLGSFTIDNTLLLASQAANSLTLAAIAASGAVAIGLFLSYANHISPTAPLRLAVRVASIGYAVPGTVLAIGILVPLAWLDNTIDSTSRLVFGLPTGLLLTGTIFSISYAYVVRFMAISYGAIDAGLGRTSPNLHSAARSLGRSPFGALREVHLPLISPALATAALLVFVDAMKELPATLLLRPFDFDTLATHVYTFASLGQVEDVALGALMIVAVGIVPVIALNHTISAQSGGVGQLPGIVGLGKNRRTPA
ncbi:MAG: ABC transporter permease [Alphaproteobacteria bacterium]